MNKENFDRSKCPIIYGTSIEIPAYAVKISDKMAQRNSAGGFIEWCTVTSELKHGVIFAQGCYTVDSDDELIEIKMP